ncbi:hypothetical protein LMG28688_03200 [Paraburkholderia caffeinitolerans]|uniref:Uncharacterized protein n=1 Tax=Paraburkholderia caffeinitolerans TaxID=1723730 RepID=A0A6J5G1K2_9BURK|nr:hypothetical protein LMG28688_03200 [Paraburkholderia caffeinitolerans]
MNKGMDGKVMIVTGAGTDAAPADHVVAEIQAAGGQAVASKDSVAEWASAQRVVSARSIRALAADGGTFVRYPVVMEGM